MIFLVSLIDRDRFYADLRGYEVPLPSAQHRGSPADGTCHRHVLHVKPSKFDRARVIPIGDGLGRVIAEIIRHVRRFNRSDAVPAICHRDHKEKRDLPRAPYLLQSLRYPAPISVATIRGRLAALSLAAGARKVDGSPLRLRPHDCRRIFASEHLNNNTPIHVIQALLGHATLDTVMVYAKLYPSRLVEEYRKAVRDTYEALHGPETLRAPTADEWAEFSASCSLRDMGTHVCALPTGEHCSRGLVCLGCTHAQPKKSAAPVFRRMLVSHRRTLTKAREQQEPAGQLAARELEIVRIEGALRRAEETTTTSRPQSRTQQPESNALRAATPVSVSVAPIESGMPKKCGACIKSNEANVRGDDSFMADPVARVISEGVTATPEAVG